MIDFISLLMHACILIEKMQIKRMSRMKNEHFHRATTFSAHRATSFFLFQTSTMYIIAFEQFHMPFSHIISISKIRKEWLD